MAFKLGSEKRGFKNSSNVKIVRTPLEKDTIAEARNDGTIAISEDVPVNSSMYRRAVKHEMKHMEQMQEGRANYGDDWVYWEGRLYLRRTINGEAVIDGPNGRHPDGSDQHPWEQEAMQAEKE